MTTVYTSGLVFSRIEVLESLPAGDLKTGRDLFESVLRPAEGSGGPPARYQSFTTAAELGVHLGEIAAEAARTRAAPILHLEAHGSASGMRLASGEVVPWSTLASHLTPINQDSKMNLLVVAGTCKGWYLATGLMPADRAPLFMLIGAPENITAGALDRAHRQFYSALFAIPDVTAALAAMNDNRDYNSWTVKPATAEFLFCHVFRHYLKSLEDGTELQERENSLVAQVVRAQNLDLTDSAALRLEVRQQLCNHRWWYDRLRRPFLMLDLFPENEPRFGLSYEKCMPPATA